MHKAKTQPKLVATIIDGVWKTQPRTEKERRAELLARNDAYHGMNPWRLNAGLCHLDGGTGDRRQR
jgi:hypothetical protein